MKTQNASADFQPQFETAVLKLANLLGDYRVEISPNGMIERSVVDPVLEAFFEKWFGKSNYDNFFNSIRSYAEPFVKDLATLVSFDKPFTLVGSDGKSLSIRNFSKLMKRVFLSHPDYIGRVVNEEED